MNKSKKVLHMISGGKDSLLAACLLLEEGYDLELITFDNGHSRNLDRVKLVADSIKKRYSDRDIKYLPIVSTAMTFHRFMYDSWKSNYHELSIKYPNIQMYQAHCLACKTAMYVHAIAYCKANGIEYISDGARESQMFFVELPEMVDSYKKLCMDNGIILRTKVFNLKDDLELLYKLDERGLDTKTYEPQCFLGCPMSKPLNLLERSDLLNFYNCEIAHHLSKVDPLTNKTLIDELAASKFYSVV